MYNSYYGLTFNPFDKQQLKEKDHFISRDFTEMTNLLNYLKNIRGIGVFTARPVCSRPSRSRSPIFIRKNASPLLLDIDKAQYLNTGILNDIKMLMNYGYDSVNYFTLILCGEFHLNDTLRKLVYEALRQRITVH